jgi:hypothetical protein
MADDSSSSSGIPPSVWIAVVVGLLGMFALNQHPFQDVRPANTAPVYRHTPSEDQDVEARLWDDALGAAANAKAADDRESAAAADRKVAAAKPAVAQPVPHTTARLKNTLKNNADGVESVLVLGAIVPGAPYADDIETRRRIRYAVLAGLHRAGLVPMNIEHVGYITLSDIYQDDPTHGRDIAAYEWLAPDDVTGSPNHRVLILWLDQDGFRDRPLWHFQKVMDAVDPAVKTADDAADTAGAAGTPTPRIRMSAAIMGPADSDGLFSIRKELEPCKEASKCSSNPNLHRPIAIYSPRATAADEWLLDQAGKCRAMDEHRALPADATLAGQLQAWSHDYVTLYRLVADDCAVTHALWTELKHRSVEDVSQIALVAERDTLYARRMGEYFGGCAVSPSIVHLDKGPHPLCFTYLRGLDGLAPPAPDAGGSGTKDSGGKASDPSTSNAAAATAPSEAATGQGQLDYLRRLGTALAARVDEMGCRQNADSESSGSIDAASTCPPNGIRAIGVLGSDFYDKLLVLQELRSAFPRVTFFTTDLDARLLDRSSLQWTRHLVVGSSLGLELRPELQSSIPPFRDSYQAATYFSTMLAVHRYLQADAMGAKTPIDPSVGLEWTLHPHVFEIGRTQAFDLADERPGSTKCDLDKTCESIAAVTRTSLLSNGSWVIGLRIGAVLCALTLLFIWIAMGTAWCFETVNVFGTRHGHGRLAKRRIFVLLILAVILVMSSAAWSYLEKWLTFGQTRMPTPIFGGASLWAAGLIEALSVLIVITFVVRGQRKLNENLERIRKEFKLERSIDELIEWRREQLKSWTRRWQEVSWLPGNSLSTDSDTSPQDPQLSPLEVLMARYLYRGHSRARLVRVSVATLLSTVLLLVVERWMGRSLVGGAQLLQAGSSESMSVAAISLVSLMGLQWLIFWVADAIFLSRSFFLDLLRHKPAWPPTLLQNESDRLGIPEEWTTMWLNLRLIGLRTEAVAGLVFYPSFVIAGLTLAALTVEFGELSFASNPIALIGSSALVVVAAVLLRRVAESWRHSVRARLEDVQLHALEATSPDSGVMAQLKMLLGRIKELHEGAFASYGQQPLVRAVLVPALTFAATVGLQYLHLTP